MNMTCFADILSVTSFQTFMTHLCMFSRAESNSAMCPDGEDRKGCAGLEHEREALAMQLRRQLVEVQRLEQQLRFFIQSLSSGYTPVPHGATDTRKGQRNPWAVIICLLFFLLLIAHVYVKPVIDWLDKTYT